MHSASHSRHGRAVPGEVWDGEDGRVRHHGFAAARSGAGRGRRGGDVPHARAGVPNFARV